MLCIRVFSKLARNTGELREFTEYINSPRATGAGSPAVAALADGRVVSASFDRTLRVSDLAVGAAVATLEGRGAVTAVAVLADDGRRLGRRRPHSVGVGPRRRGGGRPRGPCLHPAADKGLAALRNGRRLRYDSADVVGVCGRHEASKLPIKRCSPWPGYRPEFGEEESIRARHLLVST